MFPILGGTLGRNSVPAGLLVARDRLYLRKRSLLGLSQTKVGRVAHLPEGKEFVDYALPQGPAADLMARAVGFFRAVYRLHKAEAAVLLTWRDGSFDLAVPDQKVSSVSVKFRRLGLASCRPGHGSSGRSTRMGLRRLCELDRPEDDRAELDGLHVVVGDFDRRRLAIRPRSSSTASGSTSRPASSSSGLGVSSSRPPTGSER
ncbi:MAG: hypothetical protein M5T61_21090 [Acidimicrobiia bacterium]|nr:hypothetical protein [Acidimicrobiia bacterium]